MDVQKRLEEAEKQILELTAQIAGKFFDLQLGATVNSANQLGYKMGIN